MDEAHREISMLERQMHDIQESASLFEVLVPEFKQLKQCRKELKMLKQLWDYVDIVKSSIEGWKTTPWRKIDVENMDIECKKFSKEIRGKPLHQWVKMIVKVTLRYVKDWIRKCDPGILTYLWRQQSKIC